MKKYILSVCASMMGLTCLIAQNVNIPDVHFKTYLLGEASINTNGDGEIQVSEAAAFTGAIYCPTPNITDLTGIEAFTAITGLNCSGNPISSLDVSQNSALTFLGCSNTEIENLDLSSNLDLVNINISNNPNFTSLNLKNGNNTAIYALFLLNVPNLSCVEVDNASYSTSNWAGINYGFDAQLVFSEDCNACVVSIPDPVFKNYLINESAINTNGNSEIECSEASSYNGVINCNWLNISDLSGIEAFATITGLNCQGNQLNSMDLSDNVALQALNCSNNQLNNLDLSQNSDLIYLACTNNQLTELNLSTNTSLVYLEADNNQMTALNLSQNVALEELSCSGNQITTIDISSSPLLTYLECSDNNLSILNLSANTALSELICTNNEIMYLDLSTHSQLEYVIVADNALVLLNVANGNNTGILEFDATNNPVLTCIQVDNVAYSNINWTDVDASASFSEDCEYDMSIVEGDLSENVMAVYPNPSNYMVYIKLFNQDEVKVINLLGEVVFTKSMHAGVNSMDVSGFANGLYFLIDSKGGKRKFIKE